MGQRLANRTELLEEIERLRLQLEASDAALDAIRSGEVDALVIDTSQGNQVFILQGAEHPYRVMVETMNEGAATVQEDGGILYANPRLAALVGEPLERLIGSSILDCIAPQDLKVYEAAARQGLRGPCRAEIHLRTSRGAATPVMISFSPTHVVGARAMCMVVTDLTEQKLHEEIVANERFARSVLDQAAEVILVCDPAGRVIRANQTALQTLPHNPLYQPIEDALPLRIHGDTGNGQEFSMRSILDGQSFRGIEAEYTTSEGNSRYFLLNAAPLNDDLGGMSGSILTLIDVTARKQAEESLRHSERLYRLLASHLPNGAAFLVDHNLRYLLADGQALQQLGLSSADFENKTLYETTEPGLIPMYEQNYRQILSGTPFETEHQLKDRVFIIRGAPVFDGQGRIIAALAVSYDITERKQAEQALMESEQRFRTLADGTPVMIWITDPDGKVAFVNHAYSEYFGIASEVLQQEGWQPLIHPDDTTRYIDRFIECNRERQPFRGETRVRRADGQWRWIESIGLPRFSDSGSYLGMAGSSLDITERKKAEEAIQTYTEQLKRSNEELQQFAFIASHDLQEPLRKIAAFTSLVGAHSELKGEDRDYLRRVQDAARRMQKMIADLLELSRITTHPPLYASVDLNKVMKTILDDLGLRIRSSQGQVEVQPLPTIEADAIQISQLMQNLVENALKYHRPDEPPVIRICSREYGQNMVEITVQDNGIGFDMHFAEQIFQPFRRLHGRYEYEGSGIGLALCQRIAERHGGKITAHSVPGEGSTFSIVLPVSHPRE